TQSVTKWQSASVAARDQSLLVWPLVVPHRRRASLAPRRHPHLAAHPRRASPFTSQVSTLQVTALFMLRRCSSSSSRPCKSAQSAISVGLLLATAATAASVPLATGIFESGAAIAALLAVELPFQLNFGSLHSIISIEATNGNLQFSF